MRKILPFIAALAIAGLFSSGCASAERKFGRGMANTLEIVRGGELRHSMEQSAVLDGPDVSYTGGFITGMNRTLARTGVGIYEMVTAPIPPYDPVFTDYLTPGTVYPDNYKPDIVEDSIYATDSNLGFSGGDVAPIIPGSRFRIFDAH